MQPIRTAILGCGGYAHAHAERLVRLGDDIEIVAFCNRTVEKAQEFSQKYTAGKAPVFGDHHEMLDKVELDLLAICLPPFVHTDEVQAAAQKGIHIFMEKPIALSSEAAWAMVESVEQAGVKSQVGFQLRFGAAVERLKAWIDSGETGPLGLMAARYFCNSLHSAWWRNREQSGGQIVEQVIHMIDILRYVMGEPVSVFSRQANLFHREIADYTVEDHSATVMVFETGALGVIYASNGAIPGQWTYDFRVVAKKLTAEFASANQAVFTYTDRPNNPTEKITEERDLLRAMWLDLIRAIRTGGETRTPLRQGAMSLDVALNAARSATTEKE